MKPRALDWIILSEPHYQLLYSKTSLFSSQKKTSSFQVKRFCAIIIITPLSKKRPCSIDSAQSLLAYVRCLKFKFNRSRPTQQSVESTIRKYHENKYILLYTWLSKFLSVCYLILSYRPIIPVIWHTCYYLLWVNIDSCLDITHPKGAAVIYENIECFQIWRIE